MDKDTKVKVVSTVYGTVTVQLPNINFTRVWPDKGAAVMIPFAVLEEGIFDTGFNNMLRDGDLYIEDMEVKKDLGLEPEDANEPQNIIVLSEKERQYYWTELSLVGFKDKVKKLSKAQLEELADYAIEHRIMNVEKNKVIKEACGRDVIKAVQLVEQDQED